MVVVSDHILLKEEFPAYDTLFLALRCLGVSLSDVPLHELLVLDLFITLQTLELVSLALGAQLDPYVVYRQLVVVQILG